MTDEEDSLLNHFGLSGEILKHHGVKGMKWGVRKEQDRVETSSSGESDISNSTTKSKRVKKPRKRLSADQKKLISLVGKIAASYAIKRGIQWARDNPEKLVDFFTRAQTTYARSQNFMNGTKAIGPGYEVFKMTMDASGVYR